jgi:hypothetical protein
MRSEQPTRCTSWNTGGRRDACLKSPVRGDVDLQARTITVRSTLQGIGREVVLAEPKSRQSKRRLPLPDYLIEGLRARRLKQNEARLERGGAEGRMAPIIFFARRWVRRYVPGTSRGHFITCSGKRLPATPAVVLVRKCGVDDTVLYVSSTEGHPNGIIAIGRGGKSEIIAYSGKAGETFAGCVRG